ERCGGSILNERCRATCTITIYPAILNLTNPGQGYKPKRFILHPGFEKNQTNSDDIGLIELNTALDFTAPKGSHYRRVNSVCLPKADIYNTDNEYGLVAGFGTMNITKHLADWLQMGWIKIWKKLNKHFDDYGKMIIARQVANSASVC
ncbi:unnamed protein product, partial [Medioppia subpectinata]